MQTNSLNILESNVRHLGFSDVYSFAANQAKLFTQSKIEEYRNRITFFEHKYRMTFRQFEIKLKKSKKENFEKEDDLLDWRFATEAVSLYQKELKALEKC